jgi:hypothetical protein
MTSRPSLIARYKKDLHRVIHSSGIQPFIFVYSPISIQLFTHPKVVDI